MSGCGKEAKTEVEIMWTNQHGTGPKTDDRVESQIILQYMCQDFPEEKYPGGKLPHNADVNREFNHYTIRNGQALNTQPFVDRRSESQQNNRHFGLHEPHYYYQSYYRRERNKGEKLRVLQTLGQGGRGAGGQGGRGAGGQGGRGAGGQGDRDGAVTVRALASHQCGPGSIPGVDAMCGLSLSESTFLRVLRFSGLSTKTNISKFQMDLETVEE